MKILLVDPDEPRRAGVAQALKAGGLDVSEAPSGSFALTMLEWNRHDVILSRTRIDDMDGSELCGILRADPTTRELRFVLMADAGEIVPAYTSVAGIDLVLPDGTGASVVAMIVQLMRRDPPLPPSGTGSSAVAPPLRTSPPPGVASGAPAPTPPPVTPLVTAPPPVASPSVAPPPATVPAPPLVVAPPAASGPAAATVVSSDRVPVAPLVTPVMTGPRVVNPDPVVAMPAVTLPRHLVELPGAATAARVVARTAAAPTTPGRDTPAAPAASPRVPVAESAPPSKPTPRPATAAVDIPAHTFQGSLGAMEMEELVQAIAVGQKTGRLLIVLAGGGGMIAFQSGRVIHAEFGKRSGKEAFEALVTSAHREGRGKFCFIPGDGTALANLPRTISASTEQLLLAIATALNDKKG